MPEVKPIKVLLLVNPNGDKIQLHFGMLKDTKDFNGDKDTGFRWMFTGKKIPMPVRSEEWFNGFPEATMLNWLKENGGWVVHAIWTAKTNKMTVVDLPSAPVKTEDSGKLGYAINKAIQQLCVDGHKEQARELHHISTGCSYHDACLSVEEIINTAKTETDWVPVSSGKYPTDNVSVQVTYLSASNRNPLCDAMAYRKNGCWYWCDNGLLALVEVTAWRHCTPYKGDATAPATKPKSKADTNTVYFVDDGDGDLDSLHKFTNLKEAKEHFSATAYGAGYPNVRLYKATEITEEV